MWSCWCWWKDHPFSVAWPKDHPYFIAWPNDHPYSLLDPRIIHILLLGYLKHWPKDTLDLDSQEGILLLQ